MRDIKFRAWDGTSMKYGWAGLVWSDTYDVNLPPEAATPEVALAERWQMYAGQTAFRAYDAIEVMQFTGLKDKNDMEIYEGDIVIEDGWVQEVRWGSTGYNPFDFDEYRHGPMLAENCEVIGNIYETPDLLPQ